MCALLPALGPFGRPAQGARERGSPEVAGERPKRKGTFSPLSRSRANTTSHGASGGAASASPSPVGREGVGPAIAVCAVTDPARSLCVPSPMAAWLHNMQALHQEERHSANP